MQQGVSAFIEKNGLSRNIQARYIDFVSETGELGKELLKGSAYGEKTFAPTANLENEMGDCLFSLLALCDALDIDAALCLNMALEKYGNRMQQSGHIGSDSEG